MLLKDRPGQGKLDKNGFGFIAAPLGNSDNKKDFIKNQTQYPDLSGYKYNADKIKDLCSKTISLQRELKEMLAAQNRIADLKRQLSAIKLEKQYFDDYYRETNEYSFKLRYVGFFLFCIIIVELRMVFYKNLRRKNMVGDIVTVTVDRAMGTYHPEHPNMYYPINYGYIEGVMAPDGEEQDAYILGVTKPTKKFNGKIIAIVHRNDDVEEKWVVAPMNMTFTKKEIEEQIYFQEQYFDSEIWC